MQNTIQKFRQSSFVFKKPVFGLKIWKLWRAPTTPQFNIFCWNFAQVPYLPISTKVCVGIFLFCLDIKLFAEIKKRPGFYTLVFYTFINNSRSKQNKKNSTYPFADITKKKTCAKFQQKILNSMVVGACQNFQFFRQKPGFLEIIEVYFNLGIEFCITWLVLPNFKNISP